MLMGQKYINLWHFKDKSTALQIHPLREKIPAETVIFE